MKDVKVHKDVCIGCGACTYIAEDVFQIEEDGLAGVITDSIPEELEDDVRDAAEGCPTDAIEIIENVEDTDIAA